MRTFDLEHAIGLDAFMIPRGTPAILCPEVFESGLTALDVIVISSPDPTVKMAHGIGPSLDITDIDHASEQAEAQAV
jgi:hypothetical protein